MLNDTSQDYANEKFDPKTNYPKVRKLRIYTFDPSLSLKLDTAAINNITLEIPWEISLKPGPIGEYVEVVDYDPASGCWYDPINLNSINLLAQDGMPPSEGNPQFHQQMVYTVAMNTISNFEKYLGRQVFWSPRDDGDKRDQYVQRLRIYPHALRAANAYYSPQKKSLLFGYFQGPSGTVFSCLSHDIIAHETTHALLDGMHRRYVEDNHPDTLAFHEAFADIVALFQHFTFTDVLKHQIERTRGDLETQSLLGELAQQFGEATGRYGALRNAIGETDAYGKWHLIEPSPQKLKEFTDPHNRGSILVAAIFNAFLSIYKARTKKVIILASAGSGIMPQGTLHPCIVEALASEATTTAQHFLGMCIRALDYCPPFDISFGDYLRALITADYDMVPNDKFGYRIALIESFRRWGIMPTDIKTISEEQLRWPMARLLYEERWNTLAEVAKKLKGLISKSLFLKDREEIFNTLKDARRETHDTLEAIMKSDGETNQNINFSEVTGIHISGDPFPDIQYDNSDEQKFEIHSVLPTLRVTPDGQIRKQLIITMTQSLKGMPINTAIKEMGTFVFRGGSTLIFDMEENNPTLRYAITRPIKDYGRLEEIQRYKQKKADENLSLRENYFKEEDNNSSENEPFCMLHALE